MIWIVVILGYLLGSIPTAYVAGRLLKGQDIRRMGDGNMGAANAFRELGTRAGLTVGLIDAAKGSLAVLLAQGAGVSQPGVLMAGTAAVIGHNWPVFLEFRGGRGESTTLGVMLTLVPKPMLILAIPAILTLVLSRNVVLTSAVLFISFPLVCWWLGVPRIMVAYGLALAIVVALTHLYTTRKHAAQQA
ncbi:MAG: glycerol-3-phosphate acyltransferase [Dehalococcoidales bacterium]|nr:glycerol-3-phosphate acyltransferase [Dehalococcoidales bacterium]